jgi:hypothetical protein
MKKYTIFFIKEQSQIPSNLYTDRNPSSSIIKEKYTVPLIKESNSLDRNKDIYPYNELSSNSEIDYKRIQEKSSINNILGPYLSTENPISSLVNENNRRIYGNNSISDMFIDKTSADKQMFQSQDPNANLDLVKKQKEYLKEAERIKKLITNPNNSEIDKNKELIMFQNNLENKNYKGGRQNIPIKNQSRYEWEEKRVEELRSITTKSSDECQEYMRLKDRINSRNHRLRLLQKQNSVSSLVQETLNNTNKEYLDKISEKQVVNTPLANNMLSQVSDKQVVNTLKSILPINLDNYEESSTGSQEDLQEKQAKSKVKPRKSKFQEYAWEESRVRELESIPRRCRTSEQSKELNQLNRRAYSRERFRRNKS